ncbi:hypothetical protein Q7A53_03065 [Halobacillus rhizosphaerae]|uniref:hypothetical protein n=1 Tax=Halobacillus rhizosphaerae TaxID=3064889 RepID=UPI00398B23F1
MRKWLLALGLASALVAAGCSSNSSDENSNGSSDDNQSEESSDQTSDKQSMKMAVLDEQMNMKDVFKPYQEKITAYQTEVSAEEPDQEKIKAAGKEAQTAAKEAADKASNYEIQADLSDDVKSQYKDALSSLQGYYQDVSDALDKDAAKADLSSAEEKFTNFNDTLGKIYEDVGLNAPDMMKEFS